MITIIATDAITIEAAVESDAGCIIILSVESAIVQNANGDLVSTTGTITVAAKTGITMNPGALATASGDGDIRYLAEGSITVGSMDAGTGNASIVSVSGDILDNADAAGTVKATGLRLEAAGGIGETEGVGDGLIEIDAATLAALSGVGGIYLAEAVDIVTGTAPAVFSAEEVVPSGLIEYVLSALGIDESAAAHYLSVLGDIETLGAAGADGGGNGALQ